MRAPAEDAFVWFEDTVSLNAEGTELTFTWHRFRPHVLRSGDTLTPASFSQHKPLEAWTFRTPPGPDCPQHLIYVISGIWEPSLTRDPGWRKG
ncbi:MAG: hypothetical protein VX287_01065 [Actinomycetota bacterium]|nr:hypothetical protein [Actinomycetota bacterium]